MENQTSESVSIISENEKNVSAFIHISTFLKYFFPLGNFIAPIVLWTLNKEKPFVDVHGRGAINFQLSIFLYTLLIGLLCIPFFAIFATNFVSLVETLERHGNDFRLSDIQHMTGYIILFGIAVCLLFGLFVLELYAVINATMHAAKGKLYRYPICIPFLKTSTKNQH